MPKSMSLEYEPSSDPLCVRGVLDVYRDRARGVLNVYCDTTVLQKCAAVPRRARI
jgi:hypothetical protein